MQAPANGRIYTAMHAPPAAHARSRALARAHASASCRMNAGEQHERERETGSRHTVPGVQREYSLEVVKSLADFLLSFVCLQGASTMPSERTSVGFPPPTHHAEPRATESICQFVRAVHQCPLPTDTHCCGAPQPPPQKQMLVHLSSCYLFVLHIGHIVLHIGTWARRRRHLA